MGTATLFMFLGIVLIAVAIVGAIWFYENVLDDCDGITAALSAILFVVMIAIGVASSFGALDKANSKIETKTVIVPDTLVFSKNGVADTTYVYNRPVKK